MLVNFAFDFLRPEPVMIDQTRPEPRLNRETKNPARLLLRHAGLLIFVCTLR